jgi:hypothetical protein
VIGFAAEKLFDPTKSAATQTLADGVNTFVLVAFAGSPDLPFRVQQPSIEPTQECVPFTEPSVYQLAVDDYVMSYGCLKTFELPFIFEIRFSSFDRQLYILSNTT